MKKLAALTLLSMLLLTSEAKADVIWTDWPVGQDEEAAHFVYNNKIFLGYEDDLFHPWEYITEKQVIRVCKRAGIRTDLDENTYADAPALMGWVQDYFLPATVHSACLQEPCTRFRLAVMLYRHGMTPCPNLAVPASHVWLQNKLDEWFDETYVNGRQSRLVGTGRTFIDASLENNVPIWLALAQCWRESQWFTTGLSRSYNCGWGIKASPWEWGNLGYPETVQGYGNYESVEEAVKAYFNYMNNQTSDGGYLYRDLIDNHEWKRILDIYAPPYENDSYEHYQIVMQVRKWCENKGITYLDEERNLW